MNILCKIFGHRPMMSTNVSDRSKHMVICRRSGCDEVFCDCDNQAYLDSIPREGITLEPGESVGFCFKIRGEK